MSKYDKLKVQHPEFAYCGEGMVNTPIVFVFNRRLFKEPTQQQLAEYDKSAAIVERHGGYMRILRHEAGGKNAPFTKAEVDAAILAVKRAHPRLEVYTHWNGVGCYSLSVGAREKAKAKRRRSSTTQG
jgi:hypothetical protein